MGLDMGNEAMTIIVGGLSCLITYGAWFGCTIAVINLMEALSAYLHCLRLAWIEFNNEYFKAEGYPFEPLGADFGDSIRVSSEIARDE